MMTAGKFYLEPQASDKVVDPSLDMTAFARASANAAFSCPYDKAEILSAALYEWMYGDAEVPAKKRISRAVSKAVYSLRRQDYIAHNAREKESLGAAYQRWTPRLTQDLLEELNTHCA